MDTANVGHEGQIHFLNTVKDGFNTHEPNGSPGDRNPDRWLFEFLETDIMIESYHPNPDGHTALASLLGNTAYGAGGALGGGNGGDIDIVLTIDTTGSMGSSIDQVKQYAEQLVDEISAVTTSARFALVTYGDHPEWTGYENDYASRVEQTFTADSTLVKEALAGIHVDGGGDWPEAMYSGIMASLDEAWRPGVKKVVLVLADAPPHDPEPVTGYTADDVIARAFAVDPAEVYVVNTGDATYGGSLSRVVEETGGSVVDAYSASDVPGALMEALGTALAKPYAWAGGPYVALKGTEQQLDASGSYAQTGALVSYEWDFDGDSVYDRTTTGPTTRYTWPDGFDGTMAVRVTDAAGLSTVGTAHAASTPDGDEVPTAEDVCPADSDPGQEDQDGDGIGDACDPTPGWPTEDKEGVVIVYGDAADAAPAVDLRTPAEGAAYQLGQSVVADFSCTDDVAVATCRGTVADGAALNTGTVGAKTFTVDAVDSSRPRRGGHAPLHGPVRVRRLQSAGGQPAGGELGQRRTRYPGQVLAGRRPWSGHPRRRADLGAGELFGLRAGRPCRADHHLQQRSDLRPGEQDVQLRLEDRIGVGRAVPSADGEPDRRDDAHGAVHLQVVGNTEPTGRRRSGCEEQAEAADRVGDHQHQHRQLPDHGVPPRQQPRPPGRGPGSRRARARRRRRTPAAPTRASGRPATSRWPRSPVPSQFAPVPSGSESWMTVCCPISTSSDQ